LSDSKHWLYSHSTDAVSSAEIFQNFLFLFNVSFPVSQTHLGETQIRRLSAFISVEILHLAWRPEKKEFNLGTCWKLCSHKKMDLGQSNVPRRVSDFLRGAVKKLNYLQTTEHGIRSNMERSTINIQVEGSLVLSGPRHLPTLLMCQGWLVVSSNPGAVLIKNDFASVNTLILIQLLQMGNYGYLGEWCLEIFWWILQKYYQPIWGS